MKTIFERGTEFAKYHSDVDTIFMRNCYVQGATQQLEIDTRLSCEWLEQCLPDIEYITNASALRQNKQQFIESFKQMLKGENV